MRRLEKYFGNIWIRNIAFYFLVLILVYLNQDRGSLTEFTFDRIMLYVFYTVDFLWIVAHNKLLLEKFFLKKKTRTYFLLLPMSYILYFPVYFLLNGYTDFTRKTFMDIFWVMMSAVWGLSINKLLGAGIYFIVKYIRERERFFKASISAKDLELEQLKGQLNPHFLFNALNNIYSYLLLDSRNGQELILKLSELMRYILDSSKKESVPMADEVHFIESYIAFEQERLGERCEVHYTKDISHPDLKIAPLILFTFIENAFKHGTTSIKKSIIGIHITAEKNHISLEVTNPVLHTNGNSTRIGLSNTTRRLELLYPRMHRLEIMEEKQQYTAHLTISPLP